MAYGTLQIVYHWGAGRTRVERVLPLEIGFSMEHDAERGTAGIWLGLEDEAGETLFQRCLGELHDSHVEVVSEDQRFSYASSAKFDDEQLADFDITFAPALPDAVEIVLRDGHNGPVLDRTHIGADAGAALAIA